MGLEQQRQQLEISLVEKNMTMRMLWADTFLQGGPRQKPSRQAKAFPLGNSAHGIKCGMFARA